MENYEPHQRSSAARYGYLLCFRSLGLREKSCCHFWKRETTSNNPMTTDTMAAGRRRSMKRITLTEAGFSSV